MKILLLSWYFPPVNTIGALRVGKFARFLIERGHDVGVVTGKDWGHPETLPLGVALDRVVYTRSIDVNALPAGLSRRLRHRRRQNASVTAPSNLAKVGAVAPIAIRPARRRLGQLYTDLTNLPDNRIGWFPGAYGAAHGMCRTWRPDVVFASGPPFTALLVARCLSRRLGIPWIAELRDRWADDPYDEPPRWRLSLDQWLERHVLATATGLVTVTEPWAEFYRAKYSKPVATIYNGYDPLDFVDTDAIEPAPNPHLVIGYTGGIYPGRRDPSPLFEALRLLGPLGEEFRVTFCGTDPTTVWQLAGRAGVQHLVEVRPAVPYRESLAFQRQADILLLMQWNDPREQGNCPGKFFEYIGSLRPVLVIGLEGGVPATILEQRSAGLCLNEPSLIAEQLKRWLVERQAVGRVRPLPAVAREGLSRTIQFERLENFLISAANASPA